MDIIVYYICFKKIPPRGEEFRVKGEKKYYRIIQD
jgi:hypothetical protein